MATIPSYLLSLAGEYRVCSELIKRGVFVTMTYGNRKEVDVYAINDRQKSALKIEVKTSQTGRFVNKLFQKRLDIDPCAPSFWVLVLIQQCKDDTFKERFFVLTHTEICNVQKTRNSAYEEKYFQKHGKKFDSKNGVDTVRVETSWFTRTSGLRSSMASAVMMLRTWSADTRPAASLKGDGCQPSVPYLAPSRCKNDWRSREPWTTRRISTPSARGR